MTRRTNYRIVADEESTNDHRRQSARLYLFEVDGHVIAASIVGSEESEIVVQRTATERDTLIAAGVLVVRLLGPTTANEQG